MKFVFFVFNFLGAGLVWTSLTFGQKPFPDWILRRPYNSQTYFGIGYADKIQYPTEYSQRAQAKALAEISREISSHISSETKRESNSYANGDDGNTNDNEVFSQSIQISSEEELSQYELRDVFETSSEIWMLYALDKAKFEIASMAPLENAEKEVHLQLEYLNDALGKRQIQNTLAHFEDIEKLYLDQLSIRMQSNSKSYSKSYSISKNRSEGILSSYFEAKEKIILAFDSLHFIPEEKKWGIPRFNGKNITGIKLINRYTQAIWPGPYSLEVFSKEEAPIKAEKWTMQFHFLSLQFPIQTQIRPIPLGLILDLSSHLDLTENLSYGENPELNSKINSILIPKLKSDLPHLSTDAFSVKKITVVPTKKFSDNSDREEPKEGGNSSFILSNLEVTLDSLEGIYFYNVSAQAQFPWAKDPVRLSAKGGHSHEDKALFLAEEDFIREIRKLGNWKMKQGL